MGKSALARSMAGATCADERASAGLDGMAQDAPFARRHRAQMNARPTAAARKRAACAMRAGEVSTAHTRHALMIALAMAAATPTAAACATLDGRVMRATRENVPIHAMGMAPASQQGHANVSMALEASTARATCAWATVGRVKGVGYAWMADAAAPAATQDPIANGGHARATALATACARRASAGACQALLETLARMGALTTAIAAGAAFLLAFASAVAIGKARIAQLRCCGLICSQKQLR